MLIEDGQVDEHIERGLVFEPVRGGVDAPLPAAFTIPAWDEPQRAPTIEPALREDRETRPARKQSKPRETPQLDSARELLVGAHGV